MIDVAKLRQVKGRRIYQFWLDEETGEITDVTSRDDVIQVIRCKNCKYYTGKWCTKYSTKQFDINDICKDDYDFCSMAERKEE